jgi:hypothetical protein
LSEHDIWTFRCQCGVERSQQTRGEVGQRLARPHGVQINVGLNIEEMQHLVEQVAVLRRREHAGVGPLGRAKRLNHGRHLDGFGPRADGAEDAERSHERSIRMIAAL